MTVAEQQRQEQEEYRRILPDIVEAIHRDEERVSLSQRLSSTTGEIDQKLLYRWIQLTEEKLEAQRRRSAALLALVMWIGVVGVVVPVVGAVLGRFSVTSWSTMGAIILGGSIAVFGALRLRGVTWRAYSRWMERELG